MPIANLQNQKSNTGLPILATARKGGEKEEKTNKKGEKYLSYGRDLDHFRLTSEDPAVRLAIMEILGPAPKEMLIVFTKPEVDDVFDVWNKEYRASTLVRRCDGCTINLELSRGAVRPTNKPCPRKAINDAIALEQPAPAGVVDCGCASRGVLYAHVPALKMLGVVRFLTGSINDILHADGILRSVIDLGFDLTQVPFIIGRTDRSISRPDPRNKATGRTRGDKSLWNLQIEPNWYREFVERRQYGMLGGNVIDPAKQLTVVDQSVTRENALSREPDFYEGEVIDDDYDSLIEPDAPGPEDAIANDIISLVQHEWTETSKLYEFMVSANLHPDAESAKANFAAFCKTNGYTKKDMTMAMGEFCYMALVKLHMDDLVAINESLATPQPDPQPEQDAPDPAPDHEKTAAF